MSSNNKITTLCILLLATSDASAAQSQHTPAYPQDGQSQTWLDGYETVFIQPPNGDYLNTEQAVAAELIADHFKFSPISSLTGLSSAQKQRSMIFSYCYKIKRDVASISGIFTDASTGQTIYSWRSNGGARFYPLNNLISCVDDGLEYFSIRKGIQSGGNYIATGGLGN